MFASSYINENYKSIKAAIDINSTNAITFLSKRDSRKTTSAIFATQIC